MASSDGHLTDSGIGAGSKEVGVTLVVILVFLSLAFYNVLELTLITFATFRKRSGLYFWSFVVATWGIAIYSLGFLLKDTGLSSNYLLYVTFIEVGWTSMVTGQSMVLYSRLHIVLRSQKKLRMALWMIIIDAIICHIPIIVVAYGSNSPNPGPFVVPYSVYEKVQVSIFFIQELILSGIYISETVKMMSVEAGARLGGSRGNARKLMKHLVLVNIIIVVLDITILGLEYAGQFQLQTAYKGLVYSVKLKLEFSILNRLVELTTGGGAGAANSSARGHISATRTRLDRDKTAIDLDTFDMGDGDQRRPHDIEFGSATTGYNAYIKGGDRAGTGGLAGDDLRGVTRTTEVVIHSGRGGGEADGDSDSVDGKSGMTTDSGLPPTDGKRRTREIASASSSEVHFAVA